MKEWKTRWESREGRMLHESILASIEQNTPLTQIPGLPFIENKIDLRGITIPPRPYRVINYTFDKVDLSYAVLSGTIWEKCVFTNVILHGARLDAIEFWACRFDNTRFDKTDLNEALMNGTLSNDSGYFKDVDFVGANLNGTMYGNTQFERVNFVNCKLRKVDFNGSRFKDCSFTGKLDEVFFRVNELINLKMFPGRITHPNKMENVNFSNAILESVAFLDGLDISHCIFPQSDDYVIIRRNRHKVFEEARKVVQGWSGKHQKIGLALIDQYYLSSRTKNNTGEVVDIHYLRKTDRQFGVQFFTLIKKINTEING